MISNPDYYINSPYGYPYAEPVKKSDFENLKRFALMIYSSDKDLQETVRNASHEALIDMFERNGFTFDPEWYGLRGVTDRAKMPSALDDPNYRRSIGIIDKGLL